MKYLLLTALASLTLGTGCVMTPTGEIITAPVNVDAEIGFNPRVHVGTRSGVTVWLHPTFVVSDAYPIAQTHCSRWGMYARPRYDWSISASEARYLDYTCVRRRPYLASPHIIIGGGRYHRRGHYRNGRSYRNSPRRVYTPKPVPRVEPVRRRGTFGRIFKPSPKRSTVVERGKPWEHKRDKGGVAYPSKPKRGTVVERGKPWEHNADKNKGEKAPSLVLPSKPTKRSTFGTYRSKMPIKTKTRAKTKIRGFGSLKSKKGPRKGKLRL
ncbi:MAG: hypothetical protein ACRBBP_10445 [Bdellovibrionales bacterium]